MVLEFPVFHSCDVVGNGLGETPQEKLVLGVLGKHKLYLGQRQLSIGGGGGVSDRVDRVDRRRFPPTMPSHPRQKALYDRRRRIPKQH